MSPPAVGGLAGGPAGASPATDSRQESRRPRPDGLDFAAVAPELAAHLKALPSAARADERERIERISGAREYLVRLMKYVPFAEGKDAEIRLAGGALLRGAVPYCNETQVAIRPAGESALRMVSWRDLAFEQFITFLDFYLRMRLDQGQTAGGARNPAQQQDAAEDCLRLAVLCDWYGRQPLAARYGRQAVELDARVAAQARRLLPGLGL